MKYMEALARSNTVGTFFVTGTVAERRPDLLLKWAEAGHEIASHGYDHIAMRTLGPENLSEALDRSKKALEDASGREVRGFRAPFFSIQKDTLWALDVISEAGFTYDSSIVPVRTRRYGISGFKPEPCLYETASGRVIVEIPLSIGKVCGMKVPVAGGGYFRLFPYHTIRRAVETHEKNKVPFVMYCHPYEFAAAGLSADGLVSGWRQRLQAFSITAKANVRRHKVPETLRRLLDEFEFSTLGRLAERINSLGQPRILEQTR